jgi:hypothetical protein
VINLLKKWVESHFRQLVADGREVVSAALAFVEALVIPRFAQWGPLLTQLIIDQRDRWAAQIPDVNLDIIARQLMLQHERHQRPGRDSSSQKLADLRFGWLLGVYMSVCMCVCVCCTLLTPALCLLRANSKRCTQMVDTHSWCRETNRRCQGHECLGATAHL